MCKIFSLIVILIFNFLKKSVYCIESEDLLGFLILLFIWKYVFFCNVCDGVVVCDFGESICFLWIVFIVFLFDDYR